MASRLSVSIKLPPLYNNGMQSYANTTNLQTLSTSVAQLQQRLELLQKELYNISFQAVGSPVAADPSRPTGEWPLVVFKRLGNI